MDQIDCDLKIYELKFYTLSFDLSEKKKIIIKKYVGEKENILF